MSFKGTCARTLAVLVLLGGCTVVTPGIHITTVALPAGHSVPPPSFEPFPTSAPTASPSDAVLEARSFQGEGLRDRIGPVLLKHGHFTLHVRFVASRFDGALRLQLQNREGQVVAALADETGSFEHTTSPTVEIGDNYYFALPQADGAWSIDVEPLP